MSDTPNRLLDGIRGMTAVMRVTVLVAAAAAIVGVWLVSRWASAPTYVTLYRDLELSEASAISDHLVKSDIPYRLADGGSAVQVPVADMARARVSLAKDGLPTNGRPGLELFDKPSWGMTDFTQRVTFQRALEGELARTIGALRGIARAQVHLVIPTPSALRRTDRVASASVVLTLQPNAALSADAVQGITYIVSNSVEQLSSDNVAVMDDGGHVLSVPSGAGSAGGLTTRQLEIQRGVEQHLSEKVEELLDTMLGPGRARAQVSAQLSFDQVDRTVETFDPNGQVIQNEQRSETNGGGGTATDAGSQTVVNNAYQNSHKVEKSTAAQGTVTKLTVAVLVDEKAMGAAAKNPALRPERLESVVRDAIGADSSRGDRVSVMTVPFETAAALGAGGTGSEKPKVDVVQVVEKVSRPAIGIIAIVALALLAMKLLRSAPTPATTGASEAPLAGSAGSPTLGKILPMVPASEVAQLRTRLQAESNDRPETTAQVMRNWLSEAS